MDGSRSNRAGEGYGHFRCPAQPAAAAPPRIFFSPPPFWARADRFDRVDFRHDQKIDIYSLGITALELAYGRTPFHDWPPLKMLLSKLEHEVPMLLDEDKILSRDFYSFVLLCVQRNPAAR
ncbi:MAG: hypothetical protein BJ554DRAFT_5 [Olpidium bornovanus]|uniref:Protein kinase domain-containing protein n=1 Tax=Olpidium bornovanus TaxID=278681 RepID=A0A8H7ZUL0_9FUNG|nr:MAG: hypothetical protein BJ554DRAFT_5 [Olpidium bornovanus]